MNPQHMIFQYLVPDFKSKENLDFKILQQIDSSYCLFKDYFDTDIYSEDEFVIDHGEANPNFFDTYDRLEENWKRYVSEYPETPEREAREAKNNEIKSIIYRKFICNKYRSRTLPNDDTRIWAIDFFSGFILFEHKYWHALTICNSKLILRYIGNPSAMSIKEAVEASRKALRIFPFL